MGNTVPTFFPVYGAPVDAETYIVQAGDNLFRIASHFGVDLHQLAAVNGIPDPSHILVGQVLNIAAAR
jgi:LysM repeat protein